MPSKIEHSFTYPFSTHRLWEVISTEQYWRDLLEAINSGHGVLESFEASGDVVTVQMTQVIPEEKLPSVVTKIKPGDLQIPRRSVFRKVDDSTINAEVHASVTGASATIEGTLTASGDPSVSRYDAQVKVGIPLIGGKIEKTVGSELVALFDREREETIGWNQRNS